MTQEIKISINTKKMMLSGSRRVYKTEGFVSLTKKTASIDEFVSHVAEGVFFHNLSLPCGKCFLAETEDKAYTLFFCQSSCAERLGSGDLVFYKFITAGTDEGGVDRGLSEYLLSHGDFTVTLRPTEDVARPQDLLRIYLVSSGGAKVNFPLLNEVQRKIVQTENANMLVQGVAGSGKTNVCVEKIVFCACRNYRGRVLYTTFSRGLLTETQNRVSMFLKNVLAFMEYYKRGDVVFLDEMHQKAVENKLGVLVDTDDDAKMLQSLQRIADFLNRQVDYFLIEDVYAHRFGVKRVANETTFLREFLGGGSRMSGALDRLKNVAPEIIYKEIYGMIFGKYELSSPTEMMSKEEYAEARKESFSRAECDAIYSVAVDYANFLTKNNLTDNNLMSRELLSDKDFPLYSVGIVDEAQDFTQVNLCFVKSVCRKLFCVGDALQMINPSYFSFGYLKRLMYGDVTGVSELKHNYRSTDRLERISEKLGELNVRRFGTHSFVLRGQSVQSPLSTAAVFVRDGNFVPRLADRRLESVTVIVASQRKKEELRSRLAKTEILTVAEAKGLERNTVVLLDVLSDNVDKWNYLQNMSVNRKTADENSVFRYYFNLFYVGVSRAKQYLFVAESRPPKLFDELFDECFECASPNEAAERLNVAAGKIELDDEELIARIEKFCQLEQYENALFAADRLSSDGLRDEYVSYVYVHRNYLRFNRLRDAGVEYWKRGYDKRAREMFSISGDEQLFPLMDACAKGGGALDVEIVKFYPLIVDNETAKKLILETVDNDCNTLLTRQKQINETFKRGKQ